MNLESLKLTTGSHKGGIEQGACIMELVSYLAKEPWSDSPQCASSSITAFCIWINDNGDQEHRDRLLVLAPKIVNTMDYKKEPARAKLFSEFAWWNKEQAEKFVEYAKYSEYAAEYAAKYSEYAAEYAAKSAAEYAAKYSEYAAKSAEYAAKYSEYAAKSAESAAKYASFKKEIYNKAIETLEKILEV